MGNSNDHVSASAAIDEEKSIDADFTTTTPTDVRIAKVEGDETSPYILNKDQMNEIAQNVLPETIAYCQWRRVYSLERDGDSFDECLRKIGNAKRTLMVVRTSHGEIIGGFAEEEWQHAAAQYHGSASSCL